MKLIGYWITALDDEDYLLPQEFVGDYNPQTRRAIADYLDSAQVFDDCRGFSWCRFGCEIGDAIGHRERTDGQWVWPEGLSHYVLDHGVKLPDVFVERACGGVPETTVASSDPLERAVDSSFWKQWCAANRSGEFASRIISARNLADKQAAQARAKEVAAETARLGISNSRCQMRGCDHFALNGIVFCGECVHKNSGQWRSREFYDIGQLIRS